MNTWWRCGGRILVVLLVTMALAGTFVTRSTGQQTVTIKVALEEGRMANVGRFVATEYMKTHPNIKVEIVGLPDTNMNDKLVVALTSGKYVYDALEYHPGWGAAYVKSGWVRPLDKWWNDKDPYFSDFLMVEALSVYTGAPAKWAGKYYGLPFNTDVKMLVYRKDLYEKHGLKVPKTWNEFVQNCMKLQSSEKGLYGYGYPAMISDAGDANTAVIIHLWAMGGELFGPKLKPTFASPTNIKAFTELVRTIPKISAPGLYETDYNEENELFASGKVAHIIQWMPAAAGTVDDPKTSKVAGKVGYGPSYGLATRGTGWVTGITTTSPHPEETFDFLKFMSNREILKESLIRFTNGLVRKSLAEDKDLVKKLSWIPGMVGALKTARVLPAIPEMGAIRQHIAKETIRALKGQITPEQALKNMDAEAYKILEKAGYFK